MVVHDWYRQTEWNENIQKAFFLKLARSRGAFYKSQYVRIQASTLHESDREKYAGTAIDLLNMILKEWKDEASLAGVYELLADCYLTICEYDLAINAFRNTFEIQRINPGWITNAHLHFAWWIAITKRAEFFDEAFAVLKEFTSEIPLASNSYKTYGSMAMMYDVLGDQTNAKDCALQAINASQVQRSCFRYHKTVGLVKILDQESHKRIEKLALS